MDYFILRQDRRYTRTPTIEQLNKVAFRWDFTMKNCNKIEDVNMMEASSAEHLNYIDLLDRQVFLISKEMKKLFLLYEPTLQFKMFILLNKKVNGGETGEYYAPICREVDCVSPASEFNLDKSVIKNLVLFEQKIQHLSIFRVGSIKAEAIIVRLDVVESMLRRNMHGLQLTKVGVE